ncbi:hypothetical protein WH47_01585 [Habropoda laboriosa]|uniref:Uncharacterized protein n=1 Tax=Habropoda laboriosa TaxID=597456 RepID=A0A0L7R0N5_9HYME|nr:hypothetical protein WH47_01585 [Habropoda laboriosa]
MHKASNTAQIPDDERSIERAKNKKIRSVIEYGIQVYCQKEGKLLDDLNRIHQVGIRTAMSYRITTPTNVTNIETEVLNVTGRADYLAYKSSDEKVNRVAKLQTSQDLYIEKGLINSPQCECGAETEDLDHTIWECPFYEERREKFVEQIRNEGVNYEEKIVKVIKRKEMSIARIPAGFIRGTNRYV